MLLLLEIFPLHLHVSATLSSFLSLLNFQFFLRLLPILGPNTLNHFQRQRWLLCVFACVYFSSWVHRTHFPAFLVASWGHVTEFWPMSYGRKCHFWSRGKKPKSLNHFSAPCSLFPPTKRKYSKDLEMVKPQEGSKN